MREAVNETIGGKSVISTTVHAVDAVAAQILGQGLIRQTVDILSFFANLGGQPRFRYCYPKIRAQLWRRHSCSRRESVTPRQPG